MDAASRSKQGGEDMANRLSDLQTMEVSLVPKAANLRRFLLFKSADGASGEGEPDLSEKMLDIIKADSSDGGKVGEVAKELSPEAQYAVMSAMKLLQAYSEEVPGEVMMALMATLMPEEETMEPEGGTEMPEVEMIKGIDMSKIPTEVRPALEALWKANEQLETDLKKERDEKVLKQYVEKAKGYANLPVEAESFGLVLKTIAEKAPDQYSALEQLLNGLNESMKQSALFKEVGKGDEGKAGSAWDKIEQAAAALIQKSEGMTKEQAVAQVLKQNPDLYTEYLGERE